MISRTIRGIADRVEQLENRVPSWKSLRFAVLVTLISIAAFAFGIGALVSLVISTPAALGSLAASFPLGIVIWFAFYAWRFR